MKKTLAAILAAAMALSMSAVAFAKDTQPVGSGLGGAGNATGADAASSSASQTIGLEQTYVISPVSVTDGSPINTGTYGAYLFSDDLADLIQAGMVTIDVSATSGRNNLASMPKVTAKADGDDPANATMTVKFKDTWGTGEVSTTMRIRITAKENIYVSDDGNTVGKETAGIPNLWLPKGDTITLAPFSISATYKLVTNYGENMTITTKEVADRNVRAVGEDLYDNAGSNDKVIIYFKNSRDRDILAFDVKISPNQKNLNLGYNTSEIGDLTSTYSDIDFEFITFEAYTIGSGANKFQNSGTLYFNALGGSDTKVYEVVGDQLNPLPIDNYDAVDGTVSVKNIRQLTSYVVASDTLIQENEEESSSEPADVTPATPSNPATGAL